MTNRTALLVLVAACGGDGGDDHPPSAIPAACNPLGGQGCLLPWPSLSYAAADAATATGYRLDLPAEALPVNAGGVAVDPAPLNARWDGFSPSGPMLAMFPGGVSPAGLPSFKAPEDSLAPGSPIVLLDLDRGERAALFAEVDQNVAGVADRALVIRPLVRLRERTHYADRARPDRGVAAVPARRRAGDRPGEHVLRRRLARRHHGGGRRDLALAGGLEAVFVRAAVDHRGAAGRSRTVGEVLLIIDIVQSHSRPEHVHLLLSVPPDLAPSRVMQAIEGKTSYFVATSGNVTDDVIKKDIELPGAEPQDDDRFGSAISLHPRGEAVRRLPSPANPPPQSVRAASASASAIAAASG